MMGDATIRAPGTRRARFARWLGLDHNPLRRSTDRLEAACRLAVLILFITAVPVAAVMCGRVVDQIAQHQVQAQQASHHLVRAILTRPAPASGTPDPYTNVQTAWVPARWTAPDDGSAHTGQVLAPAGAAQGSAVSAWIDASGTVTDPPASHSDVVADVVVAVTVSSVVLTFLLLGLQAAARRTLDHRRLAAWDDEWRATGPLWTGHRS
jgi:hypothetical protein